MAQQASRSSVELYTQLYFKGKVLDEEGHVIRVLRNGFAVLVPKYGIEGIVYTSDKDETGDWHFDAERQELRKDDVLVHVFKKVGVRITVQETAQQGSRSKVVVQLTDPFVEGLSPRQNEEPVHAGVKRKVETS